MTSTVFSGGQIFDGTGAPPERGDIRVENGRITEIGTGLGGDLEIDVTGKTLFPGFFDCHVHVTMTTIDTVERLNTPLSYRFYQAIHNMQVTLDAGITSVRDASGADLGVKQAVDNGLVAGPRMQISIAMLSQTGGHGDGHVLCGAQLRTPYPGAPSGVVDGPDEMRKRVRELIREGASVIKVATSGGVLSPISDPTRGHLRDVELEVLVVSQFTLYGDTRKGRRPGYTEAARPEHAEPLVDAVVRELRSLGATVRTGKFQAEMAVEMVNDGPITLWVEV